MATFDATATYTADLISISIAADGSAVVTVRNRDAQTNVISDVTITVPVNHAANTVHQRTGDTGVAASLDMGDAIDTVIAQAAVLLQAVIDNDKHAL